MAHILLSPLAWGLGHATRDIPIIKELESHGHQITIATSRGALELLKKECPNCGFINFEDYPLPYSSSKYFLPKFFASIPRIMKALVEEHNKTRELVRGNKYDIIISDSRFGVYSEDIPSFFISHQLRLSAPGHFTPLEEVSQYINEYFFKNFKRIIVPSNRPGPDCLSGKLCQTTRKAIKAKAYYAGILSSAYKMNVPEDLDFLIIISGPEPQRAELEKIILSQVRELPGKKVVLLGRPGDNFEKKLDKNTVVKAYVSGKEKMTYMNRAKFIIARSGYTTMMDIAELDKKHGFFIPTPGQTEQEYLSEYYEEKKWFYSQSQYKLDFTKDIGKAMGYHGFPLIEKSKNNVKRLYKEVLAPYLD